MKRFFNFLLLFFAFSFSFAQSKKEIKRQGLAAFKNKDNIKTKNNYIQILEKDDKTWETYTILGDCEFKTGNPDKAFAYYKKAQEKNPIYSGLYLRVATVLRQQKKYDEPLMNFRQMLITNPRTP